MSRCTSQYDCLVLAVRIAEAVAFVPALVLDAPVHADALAPGPPPVPSPGFFLQSHNGLLCGPHAPRKFAQTDENGLCLPVAGAIVARNGYTRGGSKLVCRDERDEVRTKGIGRRRRLSVRHADAVVGVDCCDVTVTSYLGATARSLLEARPSRRSNPCPQPSADLPDCSHSTAEKAISHVQSR